MNDTGGAKPAILFAGGRPAGASDASRLISGAFEAFKDPTVAYIGAASGDSFVFFKMMQSLLKRAGAKKVTFVRLAKEKIDVNEAKGILSGADIVFFSGGEVEDGIDWIRKHGLADFLRDAFDGGKQFVGMSAGSIMLGAHWVRWDDPKDNSTARVFDCLGIVPAVFDTHAEDEDWIELKTVLKLMGDGARGYGLPAGGVISADHSGNLVNLEKEYLTFVNENGEIRRI